MSIREWKLLLILEVCVTSCAAVNHTEPGILQWIYRRPSSDFYHFINSTTTHLACGEEKNIYLISENQCVKNQELFSGCSDIIVPTQSLNSTTIAQLGSPALNIAYLLVLDSTTNNRAIFKLNETNQLVNSPHCSIFSLEVYRGRKQAIEVGNGGFSLSNNSNIEINADQLEYSLEDYIGELYRMNLSCSGGGLPESGCLFFKVFGRSNVTNAKFNCTVPGTLYDFTTECYINKHMTKALTKTTEIVTVMVTSTVIPISSAVTVPATKSPPDTVFVNTLLPVVASLIGDVAVILTVSMMIVCVVVRFKKEPLSTGTTTPVSRSTPVSRFNTDVERIQAQNRADMIQYQERGSQEMPEGNPTYINLDPDHCHPVQNPAYGTIES